MLQTDPAAKAMLEKWKIPMPNQGLSDRGDRELHRLLQVGGPNLQPKGTTQPQPSAEGTSLSPAHTHSATPMPAQPPAATGSAPQR